MSKLHKLLGRKRQADEELDLLIKYSNSTHKKRVIIQFESGNKKEDSKMEEKPDPQFFGKVRSKDILEWIFSYNSLEELKSLSFNIGNKRLSQSLSSAVFK
jgi:hypothetical protein